MDRLTIPDQRLEGWHSSSQRTCASQSGPRCELASEEVYGAFAFALKWPTPQVSYALRRQSRKEDMLLHSSEVQVLDQSSLRTQQVSEQWSYILQRFQDSGKTEDEIRAAAHALCKIIQMAPTDNAAESNPLLTWRLEKALRELRTVERTRLPPDSSTGNICYHLHSNGVSDAAPAVCQGKKYSPTDMPGAGDPKKTNSERVAYLPPEIIAMIISQTLNTQPRCVLDLVVPEWKICRRETPGLKKSSRTTRIVTYTRGEGHQVDFDPNALVVNVPFSSEYMQQFYRSHTHVFTLGTSDLPIEPVEDALAGNWRDLLPLRGRKITALLPFDDEPIDTVKIRAVPCSTPIYQHLRHIAVYSPLQLMETNVESVDKDGKAGRGRHTEAFNNALDLDRSAHLWLSWSQMPKLESVFLDLRIYSHELNTERRCLSKFHIIARAQEMGRHLRLKMLMLAGLQSYTFAMEYKGVTARDIEQWDEIDGEPNWIKVFSPAIREGGKIVLVDKLTDDHSE